MDALAPNGRCGAGGPGSPRPGRPSALFGPRVQTAGQEPAGPSGKSTSFSRTVPADSRYDAAMPSAPMASGTVTEPISVSAPPGATRNSSTMPAMPVST